MSNSILFTLALTRFFENTVEITKSWSDASRAVQDCDRGLSTDRGRGAAHVVSPVTKSRHPDTKNGTTRRHPEVELSLVSSAAVCEKAAELLF